MIPGNHKRPVWGFTLIEVMVAMLITLIVMAAVFGLLQRGQRSFRREPEITDMNQNSRSGMNMIARDLHEAGLRTPPGAAVLWRDGGGLTPDEITIVYSDPDFPISEPIKGPPAYTIGSSSTLFLDPTTMEPRLSDPEQAYPNGQVLMAIETSDCNGDGQIGMVPFQLTQPPKMASDRLRLNHNPSGDPELNPPGGFNREVDKDCTVVGVYRVVQYRINPLPPTPNPNLERRDISRAEPWIPVSANIENLQIQYAVGPDGAFVDVPAPPTSADPTTWITRVRVSVAGRTESTNLEGASPGVFSPQDTHVRKTLSTTVSLRNVFNQGAQTSRVFN